MSKRVDEPRLRELTVGQLIERLQRCLRTTTRARWSTGS